jgi:iron complex outermembrane receptor protein
MSVNWKMHLRSAIALSLSVGCAGVAMADSAADTAPAAADTGLEEILVTAQRRSESQKDVPISITAIAPEAIENLEIKSVMDLQLLAPSLIFNNAISYTQIAIRGVGSILTNPGLEMPIATYVDGAYSERGFGTVLDLLDPASVEILKGPQGTLYGANASGGAVLINSADPAKEFGGQVTAEGGNIGHGEVDGVVNLPLSDTFAARIALRYRHDGGYITNLADGTKFGGSEDETGRIKIAYTPSNDFSVIAEFQYDQQTGSESPNSEFLPKVYCAACTPGLPLPVTNPYTTDVYTFPGNGEFEKSKFFNLKVDYSGAPLTFRSISAYREDDDFANGDFNFTPPDEFNIIQWSGARTFTESLQVASDPAKMVYGIGGVDYVNDRSYYELSFAGTDNAALTNKYGVSPTAFDNVFTQNASVFAETTVTPISPLKITVGGRYINVGRTIIGWYDQGGLAYFGAAGPYVAQNPNHQFTPRFVVSYDTGPVTIYASYNQGFHAGGFSNISTLVVKPEIIHGSEIGAKYVSADRRVHANIAAFYYTYSNIQEQAITQAAGNPSFLQNAASATGKGVDFDFDYQVISALRVFGALSWLDTRFTSFPNASVQVPLYNAAGQPIGYGTGPENLTGFPLARAPVWAGNIGAAWRQSIGNGWSGEATALDRYSGSYYMDPGGAGPLRSNYQNAYSTVTLTGSVFPDSERYKIGFYVNNLTNRVYFDSKFSTAPFGAMEVVAPPRTYGVKLQYKF